MGMRKAFTLIEFSAWGRYTLERNGEGYAPGPEGDWGSYGINGWVENPPSSYTTVYEGFDTKNNWRTPNLAGIAVFRVEHLRHAETDMTRRVARKRHKQGYNALFLDWRVGYVKVEPDNIQSKLDEIKMWDLYDNAKNINEGL